MNFTYEKSRDKHLTAKDKIANVFSLSAKDGVLDAEFLSADRTRTVAFLGLPYPAPICLRLFSFPEFCAFIDSIPDDSILFELFGKDISLRTEKNTYDIPENIKDIIVSSFEDMICAKGDLGENGEHIIDLKMPRVGKSTLESATEADLILIILDGTSDYNKQLEVTQSTLEGLNSKAETLLVLNKCDSIENLESVSSKYVCISAKEGRNFEELFDKISNVLKNNYVKTSLKISYQELGEFTKLSKLLDSHELEYKDDCVIAKINCKKSVFTKFAKFKKV